jgi:hypothetical protein
MIVSLDCFGIIVRFLWPQHTRLVLACDNGIKMGKKITLLQIAPQFVLRNIEDDRDRL